MTTIDYS